MTIVMKTIIFSYWQPHLLRKSGWISSADELPAGQQRDGEDYWIKPNTDGLAVDRFWWPADAQSSPDQTVEYKLVRRDIGKDSLKITFEKRIGNPALDGLVLRKCLEISAQDPSIRVTVTVVNEGGLLPVEFSYWSHNHFDTGSIRADYQYPIESGINTVKAKEYKPALFAPAAHFKESWAAEGYERKVITPIADGWMQLAVPAGYGRMRISVEFAKLAQVYRWTSVKESQTMEWMSTKVQLDPGGSWQTEFSYTLTP